MPMNKVVHAAQRAAFSAAIDSAIKAVRGKGPENMAEQAVKLVNLAQPLLAHRYPPMPTGTRFAPLCPIPAASGWSTPTRLSTR